MNHRCFFLLFAILLGCGKETPTAPDYHIDFDSFQEHLITLSQDSLLGRDTGTPGYDSASIHIERFLKNLGLKPGGINGSYRQDISFHQSRLVNNSSKLLIDGHELTYDQEYTMRAVKGVDSVNIEAPLVFAGFGLDNPDLGYSDLEQLDVTGKIVMIIRGAPSSYDLVERAIATDFQLTNRKLKDLGALGVIRVIPKAYHSVRSWNILANRAKRPRLTYDSPEDNLEIPSVSLHHQKAEEIFRRVGRDYESVLDSLINGDPVSFEFGFDGALNAKMNHQELTSHNLAGIIEGKDPDFRDVFLIITAHLDHIGVGSVENNDSIYNGTLDNASGSAALMVMAEALQNEPSIKRSIMFLWVTAEEKGLVGSEYFANYPTVEESQIVANLNIDGVIGMIVETQDVIAYGYEHSNLSHSVDYAVKQLGMKVSPDPQPELNIFVRSDQYSFVKQGYPALYVVSGRTAADPSLNGLELFNNWLKYRYHKPSDDLDQPMSIPGIKRELEVNFLIAQHIVTRSDAIEWNRNSFLYHMFAN